MNEVLITKATTRILADADLAVAPEPAWFDPAWWRQRAAVRAELGGRGQALLIDAPFGALVLRRFQRGGLVARVAADRYFWLGDDRSRSFREFRLLQQLSARGLPVPVPVGASLERRGPFYRAGLLTRFIPDARELAGLAAEMSLCQWRELARTLDDFFSVGLQHPDLNARNLLLDAQGRWHLLDLDRARLTAGAADGAGMRRRLARSLEKLAAPGWRPGFQATVGKDLSIAAKGGQAR
ncbi:MAG: 3-deoxy-D-manno-octulosonic acid kinase [Wenzhouxiangella sp.]